MERLARACCLVVLMSIGPAARAAEFKVASVSPLVVEYGGRLLIAADELAPPTEGPAVETVEAPGWHAVIRAASHGKGGKFFAEAAAGPQGFEYTFVRLLRPQLSGVVSYSFRVPHAVMDGCHAEIVGAGAKAPGQFKRSGGLAGPLGPGGITEVESLRYLRLEHPAGPIDFDFQPRGEWIGGKTLSPRAVEWRMRRTRAGYEFANANGKASWGTIQEFKFLVRPSLAMPVAEVHPRIANRWTDPYASSLKLNFGTAAIKGYQAMGDLAAGGPASWRAAAGVRLERDDRFPAGTRFEGVSPIDSRQETTLELAVPRDGYYLLNLLVGAPQRAIGPCTLRPSGRQPQTMAAVAAAEYDSWAVVAQSQSGRLTLVFEGDFRLTALSLVPMMYANEDYLFERRWWISPAWDPDSGLLAESPSGLEN